RGGRGMERTLSTSAWLLVAVMTCLPTSARAQELRRDSVWNGVVTGAAVGAGLGLIIAKTTDDICSAPACASLLAVARGGPWRGPLGRVTDGLIGKRAPVQPGQRIDDPVANGALIGAGVGPGLVLIDLARHCGRGPGRVQCTLGGTATKLTRAALFVAAVGAVV